MINITDLFNFNTEDDIMFWWPNSAVFAAETIEETINLTEYYDIDYDLVFNDELLVDLLTFGATMYGITLPELCAFIEEATRGAVLEEVNIYTYRTPHYQLSGLQDYHKGLGGYQEHVWQASLDEYAYIFTNSHGVIRFNF